MLDGKPVICAGFVGRAIDHIFGGEPAVDYGYMSFLESMGMVLFEKDTWRPLVVRAGRYWEIQYSDYVEIEPGVSVPLRIVLITDKDSDVLDYSFDFRFKVLDGKLWLLDCVCHDGKMTTATKDVLWANGKAATTTAQSTVQGTETLDPFNFRRVTARRVLNPPGSVVLRGIMAQARPWEYPGYADLLKTLLSTEDQGGATKLHMNLGPVAHLKDAKFVALTWLSPDGKFAAIPGPKTLKVYPHSLPAGETAKVRMHSGDVSWPSGLLSAELKKEEASSQAKVEFFDATQDMGLFATLSLAIVDRQGTLLAAAWQNVDFTNFQGIHSAEHLLHLGRVDGAEPLYLLSRYHTEITAQRMGSSLGRSYDPYTPPLAWKQIFSAQDGRVWGYGLQLLQQNVNYELGRYASWPDFPPSALENDLRNRIVAPHKDVLDRLLRTTKEAKWLAVLAQLAGHTGDTEVPRVAVAAVASFRRAGSRGGGNSSLPPGRRQRTETRAGGVPAGVGQDSRTPRPTAPSRPRLSKRSWQSISSTPMRPFRRLARRR